MNIHPFRWFVWNTSITLEKIRLWFKIGVSYTSCGPNSVEVDVRQDTERVGVVSLSEVNSVHSCHTSSFIIQTMQLGFTRKEDLYTMIYSYTMEKRDLSSHGLNISPMKH